ncbi:MAG: right-handed parallel beta-helix repeat-containing protein [Thermomicrobiales bacterium]
MDTAHFDALTRVFGSASRRRLFGALTLAPLLGLMAGAGDDDDAEAGRRRRRKRRHKRRKNPGNRKGGGCTPKSRSVICSRFCGTVKNRQTCGKTVVCGPDCLTGQTCQNGVCGVACGSAFCPAGSEICADGVCRACTVTCSAADHVCDGAALQTALAGGGEVYVCPGRYTGLFVVPGSATLSIFGAGMGADPATATILDAQLAGETFVVEQYAQATITDLRLTGSGGRGNPGLLVGEDTTTAVVRCAVVDNGTSQFSSGGIIARGDVTIDDSLISGNRSTFGAGISISSSATALLRGTTIRGNTAGGGGGIRISSGTVTLADGCLVTGNVATTDQSGGIAAADTATVIISADSSVVGNEPDNCVIEGPLTGTCG